MISCQLHDYIEIACLYQYQIYLRLTDGSSVEGEAVATAINAQREEILVLKTADLQLEIPLDNIGEMNVKTQPARFQRVVFKP